MFDIVRLRSKYVILTFVSLALVVLATVIGIPVLQAQSPGETYCKHIRTGILRSIDTNNSCDPSRWQEIILDGGGASPWQSDSSNVHLRSGNVGVGTADPRNRLHIVSDTPANAGLFVTGGASGAPNSNDGVQWGEIILGSLVNPGNEGQGPAIGTITYDWNGSDLIFENTVAGEDSNFVFKTNFGGVLPRMTIRGSGNVGIGTSSPKNRLDISGGAVIGSGYAATETAPTNGLLVQGSMGIGADSSPDFGLEISGAGKHLGISSSPTASADGDLFVVDSDGNVGIGVTIPAFKLSVAETTIPGRGVANIVANFSGTSDATLRLNPNDALPPEDFIDFRATSEGLILERADIETLALTRDDNGTLNDTQDDFNNLQILGGYIQLDLTSGAPPDSHCNEDSEKGRMKVDKDAGLLYICVTSGWIVK